MYVLLAALIALTSAAPRIVGAPSGEGVLPRTAGLRAARLAAFERELDELRRLLAIPGMSAAVVLDRRLVWAHGFGFADYEARTPATTDTAYPVASLTKTFTAVLAMQLVERGALDLDAPVSKYSADFTDDSVRVRHLLSHTSNGTPGHEYRYDAGRYWYLTRVLEACSGEPFRQLLVETILDRVGMTSTAPGLDALAKRPGRYDAVARGLAKPYMLYGSGQIVRAPYPPKELNAAAGVVSTVVDLAKYDAAIDGDLLVSPASRERMFAATVSDDGKTLPYGLGWFVEDDHGLKLIWHHGSMPDFSALILKVPAKGLTLILLANSDGLSHPFPRMEADGDVLQSAFACAFLRTFVRTDAASRPPSPLRWGVSPRAFAREVERRRRSEDGYDYAHELEARAAMAEWLARHRAEARHEVRVARAVYRAYVGRYEFEDGYTVTISMDSGKLLSQGPGEEKLELFPASETEYFLKVADSQITFVRDARGRVTGLVQSQGRLVG